jgi:hypothetical protein
MKVRIILHKSEIAHEITKRLGLSDVHFSRGSTEPKELFVQIANTLGIDIVEINTKPGIAKKIVELSGENWHPDYESSGSTVTLQGLIAVNRAVEFFLDGKPEVTT